MKFCPFVGFVGRTGVGGEAEEAPLYYSDRSKSVNQSIWSVFVWKVRWRKWMCVGGEPTGRWRHISQDDTCVENPIQFSHGNDQRT